VGGEGTKVHGVDVQHVQEPWLRSRYGRGVDGKDSA